ncbi:MAG TPA: heavy metal translocating P-type ATPase [Burkholderiales bacterium]|nr:heavy metal translocating P-type ATPase [Burkholderiales bacterium]
MTHIARASGPLEAAAAVPACFHCGLPVAEPGHHRASVLGAPREFCCAGCEAVARTIVAAGFERYYEARAPAEDGAARAPLARDLPPAEVYDDPAAQREFVAALGEHEREASLILDRIRCAACLWLNEQYLRRLPGVTRVDINYATHRAQVAWDARRVRLSQILEAIRAIGYDAYPYDPQRQADLERSARRKALWRLFVAGFGATQVMMYAVPAYLNGDGTLTPDLEQLMRWASLVLTLPVVLFSCGPFFSAALQDLRQRRVSLDTPIALGIAAGFAASAWATVTGGGQVYFDSITMLVFLLLGARYLELVGRQRAGRQLDHLARWMPSFALRLREPDDQASAQRVAAHTLAPGDFVLVPAGDRVPADGVVERGSSSADESLLTGESRPLSKAPGAALVGGSVNLEQAVVMRVTRAGADTQAAAIGRLVERAAASKPKLVAGADRLAHALTYVVLAVAAAAFLYWLHAAPERAAWVAVAVLVATCPCALALAAPIALTAAGARLLERGVVLTRSGALEALSRATDVVLDKTGTLTRGRFGVARIVPLGDAGAQRCLVIARALEVSSRHPIAQAFSEHAGTCAPLRAEALTNFPGHGVEGRVAGRRVRIGTEAFCRELCAVALPAHAAPVSARATPVYLAGQEGWLGEFLLEDRLRADAPALVAALHEQGLRVHLVSGDHPEVVEATARLLGIDSFAGGATPQDKFAFVARLQRAGRVVAMLGDGLNDAPVLARADASLAMGGGADAAQLQADLVLLGARLGAAAEALAITRRTMRVIRQNFAWAIVYNGVALPLAASGWIGPWQAAIGMAASSFVVVLNALRLARRAPVREAPVAAAVLATGRA